MLDINSDIDSLSNFKRNTPEFLRQLKETGHPVVLTINGKAELVVQDTASYQKLIELAERAERMDALKASIEDMKAGRIIPADDVLAELRQILRKARPVTYRVVFTARARADAVKQFHFLADRSPPAAARWYSAWRKPSPSWARCPSGIP